MLNALYVQNPKNWDFRTSLLINHISCRTFINDMAIAAPVVSCFGLPCL
jgi:hypothetical protein